MEQDLGPDFHAFLRSYEEDKISALRINPIKATENTESQIAEMLDGKVVWCDTGYYYKEEMRPGIHPYHAAGVYYIQDASAQLPVEMLSPNPGDIVLDLCAAPGGKSTQIAGKLMGQGLLVTNEPSKTRVKILSENIERLGIRNAVVVSEYPDKLAKKYPEYFDKILVDAPCSGEGMFRKNHAACDEWSLDSVQMCADRQAEILDRAYEMLIPGGRICYSTCTFSKEEDENSIAGFIERHPDMTLIEERRLWPHEVKGEGHYAALLEKADLDDRYNECVENRKLVKAKPPKNEVIKDYNSFIKTTFNNSIEGVVYVNGEQIYLLPEVCPDFSGIHVIRAGLNMGTIKKNRFEPSHALALAAANDEVKNRFNIESGSQEIDNYLKGQVIEGDVSDGWILIQVDGYSIGWGKAVGGRIKNHYPKGLRSLG